MVMGVDPQKLAEVQQVSRSIKAKITINYKDNAATIEMFSSDPAASQIIPGLLSQFVEGLATQLQAFFAISGEIIEVGKK